ncbi:MAG TPA: histidine kinase [Burkholderiales bacterium]|nr:histidine kinase [Burkholderiales bacterium]
MLGLATEYFACWPGVLPLYSGYVRMVFSFMNLFRNDRPTSAAIADRPSLRRDLLVLAAVPLLTFALSSAFQLNEWIGSLTGPREAYQADELPLTLLALAVGLAWFSWRRSRQMMEQVALRLDSEEQYRMLFTENLAANLLASLDGRIKLANPAAVRLLDFASPDELNGRLLQEFYVDRALWVTHRDALRAGRQIELPALQLTRRDGAVVHAAAKLSARLSPAREPELHIYLADMTDVTAMQGQLANALQENRRLSQRSMQVQEEERRNLARELHDELGQSLNAIKVDAVTIRDGATNVAEVQRSAKGIIEVSGQVYDVVRSLMRRLRPVALDELGLRSAVEYGIEQWRRRHPAVRCTFVTEGELDDLGEQMNITLYRLAQECLTNVAKHAQATEVAISLVRADGDDPGCEVVRFSFEDNGHGFNPGLRSDGLGLIGLRERVEALGGRLDLRSAPEQGARVCASIPLKGNS